MKIRIKGNSLRLRLTRSEVEKFSSSGEITDKTDFGLTSLYYALVASDSRQLSASFENNCIRVFLPVELATNWNHSDKVGFEGKMDIPGSDEPLLLLVEKDFTCMDKVNEDQSDNYPNPLVKEMYEHE